MHKDRQPSEADLARFWQFDGLRRQQNQERLAFEKRLRCESSDSQILLGRAVGAAGEGYWVGLEPKEFLQSHSWIMGSTGAGKTFLILSVIWQLLKSTNTPIIVVDRKGELTELLLDLILPSLSGEPGFNKLLGSLRIIRPFDAIRVPLLRLTAPEPGVSQEVQAMNLASSLEDALGQSLGIRMDRDFLLLSRIAIALEEPLTILSRWLSNPASLARESHRLTDPQLREFARTGLAQENAASLSALAARLDSYLFLPETRLALSAPSCLSFQECFEEGLTSIETGNPPAGAEKAASFWSGALNGLLTRAIMSRSVSASSPHTLVIWEEFQESLSTGSVDQFSRLLALSRFKKIALMFSNQQAAQLASVDVRLPKLLRTNTAMEMVFRSNYEDAKAVGPALFRRPRVNSKRPADDSRFEELTCLPDREFYLWLKKERFGAQRVRSPRLDLKRMEAAARSASGEVLAAIHRGTVTIDRAELEATIQAEHENKQRTAVIAPSPFAGPSARRGKFPRLG